MTRFGLGLLASLLVGCNALVAQTAWPLQASLDTPDGVVGVYLDARGTHLVLGDQDTGGQKDAGAPTINLFSFGGETGRTYNSFVFGLAPPGATQFELDGLEYIGGGVIGGTYVVALKTRDILPQQLVWRFRSSLGAVLKEGSNITP
ncbi:MAG: hypothetical protein V4515_06670 [Chloroflexota bacterium]